MAGAVYPDDGVVTLELAGAKISGWTSVRITRGIERCPSDFDIAVTEKYPGQAAQVAIEPGQVCRVRIGNDLVLTGYVDRYRPSITPESHTVQIAGRSACEDIVDCMVQWRSGVINGSNVRDVAEKLCEPYGVKVTASAGDGPYLPQIVINLGESPYQVIERVARYGTMLAYDDVNGNLVLATVGDKSMASGFREAVNVLSASPEFTLDSRFTHYHAYQQTTDSLTDLASGHSVDGNTLEVVTDPGMLKLKLKRTDGAARERHMAVITEQIDQQGFYAVRRAKWEMARRYGRSQAVRVEADSWRDAKGKLWEPNYRAQVNIPSCKVNELELVIGEVTYVRDGQGTRAELVLMPKEAFEPEPVILFPFAAQIQMASADQPHTAGFNPRLHDAPGGV